MVQILIPSTLQKQHKNTQYTLYCIEVYLSGKCYKVDRRYSEFYELHRKLKKYYNQIGNLPPKRLKNLNQKLIEQRRISLEKYLQNLCKIGLNTELDEFLNLPIDKSINLKNLNQPHKTLFGKQDKQTNEYHQCMIGFKNDYLFSFDYDLKNHFSSNSSANSYSSSDSQKSDSNSCASSSSTISTNSLQDICLLGYLEAIYSK